MSIQLGESTTADDQALWICTADACVDGTTRYARPRAEDVSRLMSTRESITDLTSTLCDTFSRAVDGELDQADVPGIVETIDVQVRSIVDELERADWRASSGRSPRSRCAVSRVPTFPPAGLLAASGQ